MFKTVIDTRSIWLIVALGTYWAWGLSSLHDSLGVVAGAQDIWTVNAGAHALVLLGCAFATRALPRLHNLHLPAPALYGAGILAASSLPLELLLGAAPWSALCYCGPAVAGGATAVLALALFPQLARIAQPRELFVLVAAAVAVSPLLSLVILALPRPMDIIVLALLPVLSAFCLLRGYPDPSPSPQQPAHPPAHYRMITIPLVLCSCIFALCTSLFSGTVTNVTGGSIQPAVLSITVVAMVVVLSLVGIKGSSRWPVLLVLAFMPTLAAGVLLVPFLVSENRLVTDALISIARNLFSVYLYVSLAVIIAQQGRPLFTTGIVIGVGDLGHVVGSLIKQSSITASDHQLLLGCIVIAYLVFICALLLMYPRGSQTALNFVLQPTDPRDTNAPVTPLHRAAQAAGLSEREEEVLQQLVGSRTLSCIADDLGISYNTAKTHTSRIFRKTGVNSRSDLAAWVGAFADERAQTP